MHSYNIIEDNDRGKGPFSLEQIEEMMARGEISKSQEVIRLGDKKSVSAEHAVIFHQEEAAEKDSIEPSRQVIKMILGILCCILGLGAAGLFFHAISMDKAVSLRKLLIAIVLVLAGIKLLQGSGLKNKG